MQSQSNALSENKPELLPNINSYTSYLTALRNTQQQLSHSSNNNNNESSIRIVALAEKAHDTLVQMEDISGVSDTHHSSMRLSGIISAQGNSGIRHPSIRPSSIHYDFVIESLALARDSIL